MDIPKATLSSKKQITIPAEVCKKLKLKIKGKIFFVEIRPCEFQLVPETEKKKGENWAAGLYGKYRNDKIDAVQSLLDDRKMDLELEKRGF